MLKTNFYMSVQIMDNTLMIFLLMAIIKKLMG